MDITKIDDTMNRLQDPFRSSHLLGLDLTGTDDVFGRCVDVLFDDRDWVVRYLVADTGRWLHRKHVLISPVGVGAVDLSRGRLAVSLTRDQIAGSPELDDDAPVSREYEKRCFNYFGWSYYWGGIGLWGSGADPTALTTALEVAPEEFESDGLRRGNLRSVKEVVSYEVVATDGNAGVVDDFVIELPSWSVESVVVRNRKYLPGGECTFLPTAHVSSIQFEERELHATETCDAIYETATSPEKERSAP